MRLIVSLTLAALHTAVVVLVVTAARELPAGGDIIAFSASGGATQDIFLQDVSRGLVRNLTSFMGSHHETQPAWSPDGMQLVFASAADPFAPTDLYVIGMDGRGLRQLTDSVESEFYPAWSPDGYQIAFMRFGGSVTNIYRMDVNGENIQAVPEFETFHSNPVWSPDGKRIASYSSQDDEPGISLMEANGTNEHQLVRTSGGSPFAWSPDASQIAFVENGVINLVNIQDGKVAQLELRGYQGAVSWLPDGNRLVYLSRRCDACDLAIYVRDMDTGEEQVFAGGVYGGTLPAWRPG